MKIIDLLNKIANGEKVPKTIYYCDIKFEWTGLNYYCEGTDEFLDKHICLEDLEQEVEIIEEDKKIEKLGDWASCYGEYANVWSPNEAELKNKINEIIEVLNDKNKRLFNNNTCFNKRVIWC